jgi:hypothetical protein
VTDPSLGSVINNGLELTQLGRYKQKHFFWDVFSKMSLVGSSFPNILILLEDTRMFKSIVLCLIAACMALPAIAEDAVQADPTRYTVEFENDKVRIIRVKYGPGEKPVMHSHGPNVSILLTKNVTRMTFPDGTTQEAADEVGTARWNDAGEHLPENLSNAPLEVVLVELKE